MRHAVLTHAPFRTTLRLCADTRYSAVALSVATALFLPWFLLYVFAGSTVLSPSVYQALDVTSLNLGGLGI